MNPRAQQARTREANEVALALDACVDRPESEIAREIYLRKRYGILTSDKEMMR